MLCIYSVCVGGERSGEYRSMGGLHACRTMEWAMYGWRCQAFGQIYVVKKTLV